VYCIHFEINIILRNLSLFIRTNHKETNFLVSTLCRSTFSSVDVLFCLRFDTVDVLPFDVQYCFRRFVNLTFSNSTFCMCTVKLVSVTMGNREKKS
jgi:hypothetical protein